MEALSQYTNYHCWDNSHNGRMEKLTNKQLCNLSWFRKRSTIHLWHRTGNKITTLCHASWSDMMLMCLCKSTIDWKAPSPTSDLKLLVTVKNVTHNTTTLFVISISSHSTAPNRHTTPKPDGTLLHPQMLQMSPTSQSKVDKRHAPTNVTTFKTSRALQYFLTPSSISNTAVSSNPAWEKVGVKGW